MAPFYCWGKKNSELSLQGKPGGPTWQFIWGLDRDFGTCRLRCRPEIEVPYF